MSRVVAAAILSCLFLSAPALASTDAAVKIRNNSSWDIHYLYLSLTSDDEWGVDQLGDDVIEANGGEFTLTDIPCGAYDVRLVDEDQDECVVSDVALCAAKGRWVITDQDLLECQAESR